MKRSILSISLVLVSLSLFSQISLSTSYTEPTCIDLNDGSVSVTASGGVAPYTYQWSGFNVSASSQTVNNLYADIYDVTVTDANSVTATASVSLPNPSPLVTIVNMDLFDPDPCDTVMCVEAFVDDDTYVQSVNWTPNTGSQGPGSGSFPSYSLCDVLPNTGYTVEITDQNGCLHTSSFQTPGFGFFEIATTSTDATCSTGGTAVVSALQAGSPSYAWSNGATTPQITGLAPGTYHVTVTTGFGNCTKVDSAVVGSSGSFSATIVSNPDPCQGLTCMSVNAPVNSSFLWSNFSTASQTCTSIPGTYSVTVVSAFGCTATASTTVTVPQVLDITLSATPASCGNDGSVSVLAQNGATPYSYEWNTTSTQSTLNNMPAGNYTVTVFDANGCMKVDSIDITNGSFQVDSVEVTGATCNASADGTAIVHVSGSNPPFTYNWSNAAASELATGLAAGVYTVTITDAGGCFLVQTVTVNTVGLQVDVAIQHYADCITGTNGVFGALPANGVAPYAYQWSNGSTSDTVASLNIGGYTLTVTDANGCSNITHHQMIALPDCYAQLSGKLYVDDDASCSVTGPDIGVSGAMISIEPGYSAYTDVQGNWFATVRHGYSYKVYLANTPSVSLIDACGIDTLLVNVPDSNAISGLDLPKTSSQDIDAELEVSCGVARPGFQHYMYATVVNNSFTDMTISGSVTLDTVFTSVDLSMVNADFTIDSVSSGIPITVYFTCNNLPAQSQANMILSARVPNFPFILLGQWITTSGDIYPNNLGEADLVNNVSSCPSAITGAYDPNDKQVFSEGESVDGTASVDDTLLHYLIRFQNTGTDTAFTVVIRDTLDQDLDVTSFRYLASSHNVAIEFHEERIVHFVFNNILLPDSNVNEPASHGFVEYTLKVDHPEQLEEITNLAAIYFDFNPPIFTNTVSTQREIIESIPEAIVNIPVHVFPNPTSGGLSVNLGGNPVDKVEMYDMMGKQLLVQPFDGTHQADIDVRDLPNGIYLVRIQSGTAWFTDRVMVSK